jgi:hypothetical protein
MPNMEMPVEEQPEENLPNPDASGDDIKLHSLTLELNETASPKSEPVATKE